MKVKIVHTLQNQFLLILSNNQWARLHQLSERQDISYSLYVKNIIQAGFDELPQVISLEDHQ